MKTNPASLIVFRSLIFLILSLPFGSLLAQNTQDSIVLPVKEKIYNVFCVTAPAAYSGGSDSLLNFIAENISMPRICIENNIGGTVKIKFVVTKDGLVEDVVAVGKLKGYGLEEEAVRVVKLTSGMWIPAILNDKPVNMEFWIPIAFRPGY